MWTDDHDAAGADHAVEAGAEAGIHPDGLRSGLSVHRRSVDSHGAVLADHARSGCRCRARTRARAPTRSRSSSCCRRPRTSSPCSRTAGTDPRRRPTTRRSNGSGRRRSRRRSRSGIPKKDSAVLPRRRQPEHDVPGRATRPGEAGRPGPRRLRAAAGAGDRCTRFRCPRRSSDPEDMVELRIDVDKTFVPALLPAFDQQGSARARYSGVSLRSSNRRNSMTADGVSCRFRFASRWADRRCSPWPRRRGRSWCFSRPGAACRSSRTRSTATQLVLTLRTGGRDYLRTGR